MKRTHTLPMLAAALAGTLALAACDRGDNRTVGQDADRTVADARPQSPPSRDATGKAGAAAQDAVITTKVNAALTADDQLKAMRIDVDTEAGRVTLSGTAPDPTSRDRATLLAQAVDGVVAVENKLTVKGNG